MRFLPILATLIAAFGTISSTPNAASNPFTDTTSLAKRAPQEELSTRHWGGHCYYLSWACRRIRAYERLYCRWGHTSRECRIIRQLKYRFCGYWPYRAAADSADSASADIGEAGWQDNGAAAPDQGIGSNGWEDNSAAPDNGPGGDGDDGGDDDGGATNGDDTQQITKREAQEEAPQEQQQERSAFHGGWGGCGYYCRIVRSYKWRYCQYGYWNVCRLLRSLERRLCYYY